jgi:Xaa-Pro dipeptidase
VASLGREVEGHLTPDPTAAPCDDRHPIAQSEVHGGNLPLTTNLTRTSHRGSMAVINGAPVPERPDLSRMHGERHAKLQEQLALHGLDGLVLLGSSAVSYATGAHQPAADSARAGLFRSVAAVVGGRSEPLLLPMLLPDLDEGATALAGVLADHFPAGARLGIDEITHPMRRALGPYELVAASAALGAAKLHKTPDELACIRAAQRINELAMVDVQPLLRPGVRQTDLTARFLRRIVELGADGNAIDPIWQAMPLTRVAGPWTTHGDLAFPTPSTPSFLRDGDVVWVDTGIDVAGYASDFGRTWIVADDPRPTARQRAQFERWREVMRAVLDLCKPGVSALELCRAAVAANGGTKPWLEHFYLAHGVGTDSAEMPLIGTDLGEAFDEQVILSPGMVLVLEPVIWDDGAAGYRSEDIITITDEGWMQLSDHPYAPFQETP